MLSEGGGWRNAVGKTVGGCAVGDEIGQKKHNILLTATLNMLQVLLMAITLSEALI